MPTGAKIAFTISAIAFVGAMYCFAKVIMLSI